jgi:hypothetical protein
MFSDESTFRLVNPWAQRVRRLTQTNRYKQQICGGQRQTLSERNGVGLFQRCRGPGVPLFFAPQGDHERGPIHGDAAREADFLDGPSLFATSLEGP